jgi:sortase A
MASHAAINRFHADAVANHGSASTAEMDFSQWSPQRIKAYKDSLTAKNDLPLAILYIPKINLEVPVFNDTDDLTLNRGVGRIVGTAHIGQPGNVGIAGHRDGFFRGLKDVGRDDVVELIRPGRTDHYVITEIQIVSPEDVQVLAPTSVPTLTLITCYPFYFVGSAPQRYIVSATMKNLNGSNETAIQSAPFVEKITSKEE